MVTEIIEEKLLNDVMISGDILSNIVQHLPHPAHVKDIKSGKYVLSNKENVEIYGIEKANDIIGTTVHDLDSKMRPRWGKVYVGVVDRLDYDVSDKSTTVTDKNRVLVNSEGLLRLQTMVKIPAKGFDNKPKAILTFSYNLLDSINDCGLFQLYINQYTRKTDAIKYFLKHLEADKHFYFNERKNFPSKKQVLVLLALAEHGNYKRVAAVLDIAYKTVESHILKLKNKITSGNLDQIIHQIRKRKCMGSNEDERSN